MRRVERSKVRTTWVLLVPQSCAGRSGDDQLMLCRYKKASLVRILTLQRAIQRVSCPSRFVTAPVFIAKKSTQVRTSTEVITDQTTQCLRSRQEEQDLNTAIEKMRMVVATFKEEERQRKKQCAPELPWVC